MKTQNLILAEQAQLETKRLVLRKIKLTDADALFAYTSDAQVSRYMTWDRHQTIEETREAIANFFIPQTLTEWVIVLKETNTVIGMLDLQDLTSYSASLGWVLNRTYWGHGYMPEAAEKLLNVCFTQLHLEEVHAVHDIANVKSGRVMEKLGMQKTGWLPAHVLNHTDGRESLSTVDYWSITKDEYSRSKNRDK